MLDQKTMQTRCLGAFSVMWVTKLLISPVKIRIFCPRTTKIGIFVHFGPGLAGSFGALLVGWLVVVARGLYLARHLFTLLGNLKGHLEMDRFVLDVEPAMMI